MIIRSLFKKTSSSYRPVSSAATRICLPTTPLSPEKLPYTSLPFCLKPSLAQTGGRDKAVYDFVMKDERAVWAGERIIEFIEGTLPGFEAVQKFNLLVALGCTGGKHRSVTLVNWLKERFKERDRRVLVIHRDVEKL